MQDIQLILQLIAEAKDLETVRIKIFLTSGPEFPIFDGFRHLSGEAYQDFILHDISLDTVGGGEIEEEGGGGSEEAGHAGTKRRQTCLSKSSCWRPGQWEGRPAGKRGRGVGG